MSKARHLTVNKRCGRVRSFLKWYKLLKLEQICMLPPFPDTVKIDVPSGLAGDLLKAAESLPRYENQDFLFARFAAAYL